MQTKMIKLSALLAVAIPNVTLATDIAAVATVVTQRAELQNPTIDSVTTKLNSLRDNLSQAHPTKALTEIKEDLLILQDVQ